MTDLLEPYPEQNRGRSPTQSLALAITGGTASALRNAEARSALPPR